MEDYFALLGFDRTFNIDLPALRQKYLQLSRLFHPDFHQDKSPEALKEIEEKSALFNKAWSCLKDDNSRLIHLIELHGIEWEKISLPPDFLMDMMELNEQIESQGKTEALIAEIMLGKSAHLQKALNQGKRYDAVQELPEKTQALRHAAEALLCLKYFDRLEKQN